LTTNGQQAQQQQSSLNSSSISTINLHQPRFNLKKFTNLPTSATQTPATTASSGNQSSNSFNGSEARGQINNNTNNNNNNNLNTSSSGRNQIKSESVNSLRDQEEINRQNRLAPNDDDDDGENGGNVDGNSNIIVEPTSKLGILVQSKVLEDKMQSFMTLMNENQLSRVEQKQVYQSIKSDFKSLLKNHDQIKMSEQPLNEEIVTNNNIEMDMLVV
jgi:hypothetical protein